MIIQFYIKKEIIKILITILSLIVINFNCKQDIDKFKNAENFYKNGNILCAYNILIQINEDSENFEKAQKYLSEIYRKAYYKGVELYNKKQYKAKNSNKLDCLKPFAIDYFKLLRKKSPKYNKAQYYIKLINKIESKKDIDHVNPILDDFNKNKQTPFVGKENMHIELGKFNYGILSEIIKQTKSSEHKGKVLLNISENFMGIKTKENTNIGKPAVKDSEGNIITKKIPEKLTLNLSGMDCVTFVENTMAFVFSENLNEYYEKPTKYKIQKWYRIIQNKKSLYV